MNSTIRAIKQSDYNFLYHVFISYKPNIFGYYSTKVYEQCIKMLIDYDDNLSITTVGEYNGEPKLFMSSILDCQHYIRELNKYTSFIEKIKMQLISNKAVKQDSSYVDKEILTLCSNMYSNYNNSAYGLMQYRDKDTKDPNMHTLLIEHFKRLDKHNIKYNIGQIRKENRESIISSRMNGAKIYSISNIYFSIFDIQDILSKNNIR